MYAQEYKAAIYSSNTKISNEAASAKTYILNQFPDVAKEGSTIECAIIKQTPHAYYYTFFQYYNNIIIQDAFLKLSVDLDGQIQFLTGNYYNTSLWNKIVIANINPSINSVINGQYKFPESLKPIRIIRVQNNGMPEMQFLYDYQFKNDKSRLSIFTDINGNVISTNNHKTYFSETDSSVTAKVFLPDPLTSAEVSYGGDFSDNDDADNEALNNERSLVNMTVKFESGVFYLRTDSLLLKDLNTPTVAVVTSNIPEFDYLRSESGFEDVNVFYHITEINDDILALGYPNLQNFYIEVDPHGASGGDISFYVSAAIPSIQFGEGGVDDAEDADVIIHEYTHAISDQASPLSNSGLERRALDEGYGDYFAASYSRKYSDYEWANIFSWDGHNEFWFGRNADTDKHYPEDNNDNYYASSEIWSGALMDIFDLIGKENTDNLVLEALYGSFPNMTMPQAALLILNAEELIFGGTYYETIYSALQERGLVNPVEINDITATNNISILNSNGFSFKNEPLIIQFDVIQNYQINCYSTDGRKLHAISGTGAIAELRAQSYYPDLIMLEVITEHSQLSKVLINTK